MKTTLTGLVLSLTLFLAALLSATSEESFAQTPVVEGGSTLVAVPSASFAYAVLNPTEMAEALPGLALYLSPDSSLFQAASALLEERFGITISSVRQIAIFANGHGEVAMVLAGSVGGEPSIEPALLHQEIPVYSSSTGRYETGLFLAYSQDMIVVGDSGAVTDSIDAVLRTTASVSALPSEGETDRFAFVHVGGTGLSGFLEGFDLPIAPTGADFSMASGAIIASFQFSSPEEAAVFDALVELGLNAIPAMLEEVRNGGSNVGALERYVMLLSYFEGQRQLGGIS
ncbi:MAG: hypothetical protein KC561_20135, partial [Myxococcales bacterium]|nr:hypothetical protein [Myxococcales bacterium]